MYAKSALKSSIQSDGSYKEQKKKKKTKSLTFYFRDLSITNSTRNVFNLADTQYCLYKKGKKPAEKLMKDLG